MKEKNLKMSEHDKDKCLHQSSQVLVLDRQRPFKNSILKFNKRNVNLPS